MDDLLRCSSSRVLAPQNASKQEPSWACYHLCHWIFSSRCAKTSSIHQMSDFQGRYLAIFCHLMFSIWRVPQKRFDAFSWENLLYLFGRMRSPMFLSCPSVQKICHTLLLSISLSIRIVTYVAGICRGDHAFTNVILATELPCCQRSTRRVELAGPLLYCLY